MASEGLLYFDQMFCFLDQTQNPQNNYDKQQKSQSKKVMFGILTKKKKDWFEFYFLTTFSNTCDTPKINTHKQCLLRKYLLVRLKNVIYCSGGDKMRSQYNSVGQILTPFPIPFNTNTLRHCL